MSNRFTFFESYYTAVKELPPEIKANFYDTVFEYALYDKYDESNLDPVVKALFMLVKPNLDSSKARQSAGSKGGSKPKQNQANSKQTASKPKQPLTDKDKDKDKDKRNKEESGVPDALKQWINYRKEIKKPLSNSSIASLTKRYNKDPGLFKMSVENSISNGYQGLFEPKNKQEPKREMVLM